MPYKEIIEGLTNMYVKETSYDIVNCMFSNDTTRILTILKENDEHYIVCQFCTKNFTLERSFDLKGDYIKAVSITQNEQGNLFCLPYLLDGQFCIKTFNKHGYIEDLNVSELLDIKEYCRPIDTLPYPMMGAAFLDNDDLFINVYYKSTLPTDTQTATASHYIMRMFTYSNNTKTITNPEIESSFGNLLQRNFPLNTFYDNTRKFVHIFYRHGQAIMVDLNSWKKKPNQQITEYELGDCFIHDNNVLIVTSSSEIFFYRLEEELDLLTKYQKT